MTMSIIILALVIPTPATTVLADARKDNEFDQRVRDFFDKLEIAIMTVSELLLVFIIKIMRVAYTIMATLGFLFWASRWNRRMGLELIVGAIILLIIVECVAPMVLI